MGILDRGRRGEEGIPSTNFSRAQSKDARVRFRRVSVGSYRARWGNRMTMSRIHRSLCAIIGMLVTLRNQGRRFSSKSCKCLSW